MAQMKDNFCHQLDSNIKLIISSCPRALNGDCTFSDFAYWQWANSYFTQLPALDLNVESVALVDPEMRIVGWPEISYFRSTIMEKLKT